MCVYCFGNGTNLSCAVFSSSCSCIKCNVSQVVFAQALMRQLKMHSRTQRASHWLESQLVLGGKCRIDLSALEMLLTFSVLIDVRSSKDSLCARSRRLKTLPPVGVQGAKRKRLRFLRRIKGVKTLFNTIRVDSLLSVN